MRLSATLGLAVSESALSPTSGCSVPLHPAHATQPSVASRLLKPRTLSHHTTSYHALHGVCCLRRALYHVFFLPMAGMAWRDSTDLHLTAAIFVWPFTSSLSFSSSSFVHGPTFSPDITTNRRLHCKPLYATSSRAFAKNCSEKDLLLQARPLRLSASPVVHSGDQ